MATSRKAKRRSTAHLNELTAQLSAGPSTAAAGVENWAASHDKQVQKYLDGDYPGAVAQAIGPDPAASAAQFADVESILHDQIEQTRAALRDGVSSAGLRAVVEPHRIGPADGRRRGRLRRRAVAAAQGVPMRARMVLALAAFAIAATGCVSTTPPASVTASPVEVWPSGADPVTAAPTAAKATVRSRSQPAPRSVTTPGAMPPGSTMAAIAERGRLIVGVDQNTSPFGYRNPTSGQLEGFDIDVAREIARRIFGDPDRIDPLVVDASQRESALQSGEVDVVVRTYSITCERKQIVDFSTVYFVANQRILARKGSGIDSAAALAGKRVCAVSGTTSLSVLSALQPGPTLFDAATWTDCLVMLQQGQVDAISTDDAVLFGLRNRIRPSTSLVPAWASSPTASESRRRTKTWSDSSTASSNKCDPTEPGSASMRDGCRTSAPCPIRPQRATRTDPHAHHNRDRPRT